MINTRLVIGSLVGIFIILASTSSLSFAGWDEVDGASGGGWRKLTCEIGAGWRKCGTPPAPPNPYPGALSCRDYVMNPYLYNAFSAFQMNDASGNPITTYYANYWQGSVFHQGSVTIPGWDLTRTSITVAGITFIKGKVYSSDATSFGAGICSPLDLSYLGDGWYKI